jgi:RNA polymerase sigma-70 factor (ECF subfamily)
MMTKGPDLETQLKSWFSAALSGDQAAYAQFLDRVSRILGAYFMKSMNPSRRSVQRVEELTQDVLLSIHEKRSTFQPELPVLPWVYAIARYRLIDTIRQESRRPQFANWEAGFEDLLWTEAQQGASADSQQDVDELLSGLTDRQKEVLVMAKLNELPLAEVAKKLDMSLSAVKVTVHRAIKAIRKKQEDKEGGFREDT